ncbi:MAG: site-specific DNA-methyltransferase, partial [Flavobacteriales bacterium]|nr:site-specific DNA-methyltransferase [Flavobacteriales bacterium]
LVTFLPNKSEPIHRWYSFVEGYSSKLVEQIIDEQINLPNVCLDMFGGVGTTALACQSRNIECISIETSPFFYEVAKTKLEAESFSYEEIEYLISTIKGSLLLKKGLVQHPKLDSKTFFESKDKAKWVFHRTASNGIFDIIEVIDSLCINGSMKYKGLLRISLASILQEISNVFKNGKCLSYKKNWREKKYTRKQVHDLFINHLTDIVLPDLKKSHLKKCINTENIILGDSRKAISEINKKIDLVITSPPYLNSRDYTDVYRLELWMLGYINTFNKERKQRSQSLVSHVQIPILDVPFPSIKELKDVIKFLESDKAILWNKEIPKMIKGYFNDIEGILKELKKKLNPNAKVYINVSNSAYSNYVIEVDIIISKIAELLGYSCEEIRIARLIRTSNQQKKHIDTSKMRESIIVLKNT